jgi:hypothetical protein
MLRIEPAIPKPITYALQILTIRNSVAPDWGDGRVPRATQDTLVVTLCLLGGDPSGASNPDPMVRNRTNNSQRARLIISQLMNIKPILNPHRCSCNCNCHQPTGFD